MGLGVNFHTQTDTEVFLKAFLVWGHGCYLKFTGMFAVLIFDQSSNEVTLVCDAFGIKPLFYYIENKNLYVAFEIEPLIRSINSPIRCNPDVVYQYLIHAIYDAEMFQRKIAS